MGNLSIYYLSVSSHFKFSCLKLHHFLRNHFGRNMATLLAFSVLENVKDFCVASSWSCHSKLCRPHTVGGGPCHAAAPECSSCPCSPVFSASPHWVPTSLVLHTLEWVSLSLIGNQSNPLHPVDVLSVCVGITKRPRANGQKGRKMPCSFHTMSWEKPLRSFA